MSMDFATYCSVVDEQNPFLLLKTSATMVFKDETEHTSTGVYNKQTTLPVKLDASRLLQTRSYNLGLPSGRNSWGLVVGNNNFLAICLRRT